MTDKPETLSELVARYEEAYDKREAGILGFLDDEGELKEGETYGAYDEHSYEAWSDSHGDLGSLLSELKPFLSRLKTLTEKHQANAAEREAELDKYRDKEGEVTNLYGYDSTRSGHEEGALEELDGLVGALAELVEVSA
ncbi:hypothetical protein OG824_13425 [Streptomyces prunicolor]|uniref:hypothetical protein n=1 Tax=Streptomyces prunicolor TaxID=67348 RepID=UPI00225A654A|nr:hypothetical protein [Streptomyces prunicolor]MCX5236203.1 hypothetical protein [Streptomyces prunicolor]